MQIWVVGLLIASDCLVLLLLKRSPGTGRHRRAEIRIRRFRRKRATNRVRRCCELMYCASIQSPDLMELARVSTSNRKAIRSGMVYLMHALP
jgi:hypothetical protein